MPQSSSKTEPDENASTSNSARAPALSTEHRLVTSPMAEASLSSAASRSDVSLISIMSDDSSTESVMPGIGYLAGSGVKGIGNIIIRGLALIPPLHGPGHASLIPEDQNTSSQSLLSNSSGSSLSQSIMPGIGYTAGSGIKGVGNILIRGAERADTRYRTTKLRALLRFIQVSERKARKKSLHRAAARLASPGKQLNDLLTDMLDLRHACHVTSAQITYLALSLDRGRVQITPYMFIKFIRILHASHGSAQGLELPDSVDELFIYDFGSDQEATSEIMARVKDVYYFHKGNDFRLCDDEGNAKLAMQLLLCPANELLRTRSSNWFNLYRLASPQLWYHAEDATPIDELLALIFHLNDIQETDPTMEFDAEPESEFSVWGSVTRDIRAWSEHNTIDCEWTIGYTFPSYVVLDLMGIMRLAHDARRPSLRSANILLPLMSNVSVDVWYRLAEFEEYPNVRAEYPELNSATRPSDWLKERALELAREF